MTKIFKFLSLFTLVLLQTSCGKDTDSNFTLKGYVKGLKKGTVYLQKQQDSIIVILDSLEINGNSNFELHTDLKEPEILTLKLDQNDNQENWVSFFADSGVTEVKSNTKLFNFNAKVKGSKQQEVLEKYLSTLLKLNNRNLDALQSNFESNSNTSFSEQQQKSLKQKYTYTIQFALNHPDSEVAPYLAVYEIPNTTVKYLDTIYNTLTPKIKESKYGRLLKETIDLRVATENN